MMRQFIAGYNQNTDELECEFLIYEGDDLPFWVDIVSLSHLQASAILGTLLPENLDYFWEVKEL